MSIWFESRGAGPALVFLHAAVGDGRMWDPQWEAFARSYKVARCDFRGFGHSEFESQPFSHGEDVIEGLDRLGIESAVLIGASLGGHVAMEIALSHPERVDGLVLVGAVLGDHDFSSAVREFWAAEDAALAAGDVDTVVELNLEFWVDGPNRSRANLSDAARSDVAEMLRAAAEHQRGLPDDDQERPLVHNVPARLSEIATPTLIMVGDQDAPDVIQIADRLASSISGAELQTIPDTAHLPSFEAPGRFNACLADFLGSADFLDGGSTAIG